METDITTAASVHNQDVDYKPEYLEERLKVSEDALSIDDGRGPSMLTYSGRYFHPLDSHPDEITILDIAHHLSRQCRFGGAIKYFYSVAQHSVICSWIAEDRGLSDEIIYEALMHDSSEAYLQDVPRPAKMLLPGYYKLEHKILSEIGHKYNFSAAMSPEVKEIDNLVLHMEARDFGIDFSYPQGNDDDELPSMRIIPTESDYAKDLFIKRYAELTGVDIKEILAGNI